MRITIHRSFKNFALLFFFSVFCSIRVVLAESEITLGLAPTLKAPLAAEQFKAGFGADVSLDWAFLKFAEKFSLGVGVGGGFSSMPVEVGDPMTLLEGKAGPFVRYSPFDRWAFNLGINGGIYQHSRSGLSDTKMLFGGALGAQFNVSPYISFFAQGGYTYRIFTSRPFGTIDAALGIRLNLSEIIGGRSRVKVEKTEQYRVFPVSWAWYENNPIASVTVTNEEPNAIKDVEITFFMESYMSEPWLFASVPLLVPGESIELPVTALFNEALLNLNETVTANGVLQTQYRSLGARKETISSIQMPVFRRNILSWDDDRRAAAFVSPRDYSARLFARNAAAAVNNNEINRGRVPENVLYAAALFEALRLYRITYVVDPSSSYIALSSDESAIDSLNYPYQTLFYRGGDCDDLSILFCSMLEALDIESAFITIPGHIYIAFEAGDGAWLNGNARIIELNGKRWVPVEITIPGEGFARAWQIGAQQWQNNKTEAALYPIREAWKIYPSVTVPGGGILQLEIPDRNSIIKAVNGELQKF